jgi:hypothetical protein
MVCRKYNFEYTSKLPTDFEVRLRVLQMRKGIIGNINQGVKDLFEPKPVYTTKNVQNKIMPEIIKGMLDSIMDMKKYVAVDYLQVFHISLSKSGRNTYIDHKQEEPFYQKQLTLTNVNNKFVGKVYIIDDRNCITVMLSEE